MLLCVALKCGERRIPKSYEITKRLYEVLFADYSANFAMDDEREN